MAGQRNLGRIRMMIYEFYGRGENLKTLSFIVSQGSMLNKNIKSHAKWKIYIPGNHYYLLPAMAGVDRERRAGCSSSQSQTAEAAPTLHISAL